MTKAESRIIANRIIRLLMDRSGFDHWWGNNDYRTRITVDIAREIRATHKQNFESKQ